MERLRLVEGLPALAGDGFHDQFWLIGTKKDICRVSLPSTNFKHV